MESMVFDCGSLLKETVPCFEELQNQKEHAEHGDDAGMVHGQENGQTDLPDLHLWNRVLTRKHFYHEE